MNCHNCDKEMRPGIVKANPLRDNKDNLEIKTFIALY